MVQFFDRILCMNFEYGIHSFKRLLQDQRRTCRTADTHAHSTSKSTSWKSWQKRSYRGSLINELGFNMTHRQAVSIRTANSAVLAAERLAYQLKARPRVLCSAITLCNFISTGCFDCFVSSARWLCLDKTWYRCFLLAVGLWKGGGTLLTPLLRWCLRTPLGLQGKLDWKWNTAVTNF